MEQDLLIFAAALIAACLGFTAALCRHALRQGAEIELGFKGPSVGLWVRLRPGEHRSSTLARPCQGSRGRC